MQFGAAKPEWSARAMMLSIEATGTGGTCVCVCVGGQGKEDKILGIGEDRDFSPWLLGELRVALPLPSSIPPTVAWTSRVPTPARQVLLTASVSLAPLPPVGRWRQKEPLGLGRAA